ncbi:MAG: acyl-CoA synthetase [Gammaproteobacteria bacterium]|nr:acyl-CoA synthetase [Gammaproteobacteria bacterium]
MLHPGIIAKESPSKIAYIMANSGREVSFGELEAESNQGAHLFRSLGLKRGDHIALLMENNEAFFKICWAAQRSGLYYTAISWRLQQSEVKYIIENCGAKTFITSAEQRGVAEPILSSIPEVSNCFSIGGDISGFDDWTAAISSMPIEPIDDESEGQSMLYSSGTTGYPKGVKKPLPEGAFGEIAQPNMLGMLYGASSDSIYLSPAPLYHAAPLGFTMSCLRQGIAVVVMEHFEAELALQCVERYRITHSQWVPTMFVRMLKLPNEVRDKYDVSSLKAAIHAAAPCPIPIKEKMIEWWGPIIYEYYAGTESNGFVQLNSEQWLNHRGSVGQPLNCKLHICADDGTELPAGEPGMVYFSGGGSFEYHNDPKKTADSRHQEGWTTLGDIGYLDQDGFLYLTDRKHFMIISGGVNIYPQETENVLIMHAGVVDVAVFGVPNEEFGEEVKAVVQPADMQDATPELEAELMNLCRENLAHFKCPKSIDFRESLPRHPTGKLYKRLLKDEYWAK